MKTLKWASAFLVALALAALAVSAAFAAEVDEASRAPRSISGAENNIRPITSPQRKTLPRPLIDKTDDPFFDRVASDRVTSSVTEWVNPALLQGCHAQKENHSASDDL
jgi:hypothetical protein